MPKRATSSGPSASTSRSCSVKRASCPAGKNSGSPWQGRWPTRRRCSCSTSRRRRSIRRRVSASSRCCVSCARAACPSSWSRTKKRMLERWTERSIAASADGWRSIHELRAHHLAAAAPFARFDRGRHRARAAQPPWTGGRFASARSEADQVEALLALGATPRQALERQVRATLRAALLPTINGLLTVGLVALPGMMTGQIVSGTPPEQAVRYQIVILYQLVAVAAVAGLVAVAFARRALFTSRAQLVLPQA